MEYKTIKTIPSRVEREINKMYKEGYEFVAFTSYGLGIVLILFKK